MKLVICAGPPTCGKTTVLRQVTKRLLAKQHKVSFLKIDVQYADEDQIFKKEFSIPTRNTSETARLGLRSLRIQAL